MVIFHSYVKLPEGTSDDCHPAAVVVRIGQQAALLPQFQQEVQDPGLGKDSQAPLGPVGHLRWDRAEILMGIAMK